MATTTSRSEQAGPCRTCGHAPRVYEDHDRYPLDLPWVAICDGCYDVSAEGNAAGPVSRGDTADEACFEWNENHAAGAP